MFTRPMTFCLALSAFIALAVPAQQDWRVDASGISSPFTEVDQVMVQCSPGDRILVMPGSYPEFQFSRGVSVIGVGSDPSEVVIERIAFHVSIPVENYHALISNLTVRSSNPFDIILLGGNELAAGTLVLDGVNVQGGVFLRSGSDGFLLLVNNCSVVPNPGYGFSGEAAYLGGPSASVEIRNSKIQGWNADAGAFAPAGAGLRFEAGTKARVTASRISGGTGESVPGYEDGGDGIVPSPTGSVDLVLEGGSLIYGGDAATGGAGGDGVALTGLIKEAQASVSGGAGPPDGVPYSMSQPVVAWPDQSLQALPLFNFAEGTSYARSGDTVSFRFPGASPSNSFLLVSLGVEMNPTAPFITIDPLTTTIIPGNRVSTIVPQVPGPQVPGFMVYAQGAKFDFVRGTWNLTNTASMRVDF